MSVAIDISHAVKKYGNTTVIPDLSVSIHNGEFFTLLGPSGCGKTTLLRMIAGFNSIEGGTFSFNGKVINDMDPGRRGIGMVFQNYAIFPNMSVRKNVEFGLKYRDFPKDRIREEADRFLKLVHVDQYADRMPEKLSGGQQQRVALARALVIRPDVLLMDEPLSNLDAKLRIEMRTVIRQIQKEVGITTIYVTHDQEEAMAISDRIAVMNNGVINHCGSPINIYLRPANQFVATFIGKSNILKGTLSVDSAGKAILSLGSGWSMPISTVLEEEIRDRAVNVSVRPEEFDIYPAGTTDAAGIEAVVKDSVFLGSNTHYFVELSTGEQAEIIQETDIDRIIAPGSRVILSVNMKKINLFDAETERSIMKGVVNRIDG